MERRSGALSLTEIAVRPPPWPLYQARVIGDLMDLDKTLERLDADVTAAISEAVTPDRAAQWYRVGAKAIELIEQIRDMRLAYQPANDSA